MMHGDAELRAWLWINHLTAKGWAPRHLEPGWEEIRPAYAVPELLDNERHTGAGE